MTLKKRIASEVPQQWRLSFLKADCCVSLEELFNSTKLGDSKPLPYIYLYHCKAALEALHDFDPKEPFYYFYKSMIQSRFEKKFVEAMSTIEEGLNLTHQKKEPTLNDIYYHWKLTQTKAILLSLSKKNQDALEAVNSSIEYIKKLPEEEIGILNEAILAKDWLKSGKIFDNFIQYGKIQSTKASK